MADTVIELGELPPRGQERPGPVAAPDRPASHRAVLAALTVLLIALTTGAVHRGPPPPPAIIDVRLSDTMFVADDRVFVVSAGSGPTISRVRTKIVSEYRLPDGDLLSRTTVTVSGSVLNVRSAGSTVLVSYQVDTVGAEATVALAAGSGRALWRRPSRLLAVSAPDGMVLLRENSPERGNVNWHGIDLATGAVRWSLQQPARGFTTEADFADGFPRLLVTATDDGAIEVRDAATGAVTASATVPVRRRPVGSNLPVWPTGKLVLVGTPDGTIAYALPDLAERWRSRADLAGRWVQDGCAEICSLSWQGGLRVLDRETGQERWSDERWNYADQVGSWLLTTDNTRPERLPGVSVVDPGTGRVHGDFGSWHPIGAHLPDGTVHGIREVPGADIVWYARLDPATLAVRVLGRADRVSGDCQATTAVLVCRRIDATVGVWRLK